MNSGIERAALMVSEEKRQQDSRKKIHHQIICHSFLIKLMISTKEHSRRNFSVALNRKTCLEPQLNFTILLCLEKNH
jgi:hypothetical protein